jgi:hypothetical protein
VLVIAGLTVVGFFSTFCASVLSSNAVWDTDVTASKGFLHPSMVCHTFKSIGCGAVHDTVLKIDASCVSKVVVLTISTCVIGIFSTRTVSGIKGVAFETGSTYVSFAKLAAYGGTVLTKIFV